MVFSTVCYLRKGDFYLMLHRTKKQKDVNKGKWIGVGGKVEKGETPEECVVREVKEETGLQLYDYQLRGIVTYEIEGEETEYMFLYTSDKFSR